MYSLPIPGELPIPGGAFWPGKLPKPGGRPYGAFPWILISSEAQFEDGTG